MLSCLKAKCKSYINAKVEQLFQDYVRAHCQVKESQVLPACVEILGTRQGLLRSLASGLPEAADGSPLPWYTYPAIEYFNRLDAKGLNIFEFGCGQSSLYWANRGANVWSVEHNPEWFEAMRDKSSSLKGMTLGTDRETYVKTILDMDMKFDVVVIDGMWRNECASAALGRICDDGIFIVDNSDWYTDVTAFLRGKGYFQVDFSGFGPCNQYCWTTTILLPFRSRFMERQGQPVPVGGIQVRKGELW